MKTERRHELQHNELSDRLSHWITAAEPYAQTILAVVIAVFVLIFAFLYMSARQTQRLSDGWDQYFTALNAQDSTKLTKLADEFPGTSVAEWSRLMTADMVLAQSIGQLFTDKADALQDIKRAADLYASLNAASNDHSVVERATFGLARAKESLGQLNDAKTLYKAVKETEGPYAGLAKQRLADINRPEVKEFYDWFAKYEPPKPSDKPDKKPDFLHDNLDSPGVFDLPKSITDKIQTVPPAMPAGGDKPAAEDKPATDKPATDEKPASDEKPATPEKPAAEQKAADDKAAK